LIYWRDIPHTAYIVKTPNGYETPDDGIYWLKSEEGDAIATLSFMAKQAKYSMSS